MFATLQRYIPLFQNYLQSKDKHSFVNTLQDPTEKGLLELLVNPIHTLNDFREKMKKINLSYDLKNPIEDYKLFSYFQSAKELKSEIFLDFKTKYSTGNFQYARPAALNAEEIKEGQKQASASELRLENSLEEYLISKQKTNYQWIKLLNDYSFSKVPEQTLLSLSVPDKEYVLDKFATIFHLKPAFISKFLVKFQNEKRISNDAYRLPAKILSNLTKGQLFELGNVHPSVYTNEDYIELWFNQQYAETIRKHVENSQYFTKQQHNAKRAAFGDIIKGLDTFRDSPILKKYVTKLKSEVLVLDTIVNDPCIKRFEDYLLTSQVGLQVHNVQRDFYDQLLRKKERSTPEPRMRYKLEVDKTVPNTFIEEYIEHLFRNTKEGQSYIRPLSRFFDEKYLRKLNAKVRLYRGETFQNASDYFNQQELQIMKDRKEIRLLSTNSKIFKIEDDVKLEVSIKNVKSINIKVYVLNLQKHLLSQSSKYLIDDEIQLSFLIPTSQDRYENNFSNPYEVIYSEIDLSKLIPKAMGVYIVDFQGETVTSRAVIRKGTIICVDTLTEAGQQFSFFDQSGKPLGEKQGLRVWIREQATELTDNTAFVSYNNTTEYGTIVAAIGDYAETFQRKFVEESYRFDIGYIYNTQSFIVGRKAKVILHGRLSMNDKTMSLELLKNIKIRVTVTNNQNIKTSFPYDIEKWSNFEDQVIEFPIQAYTRQINITVDAQITLQNKKDISLNNIKDINIDLGEGNTNFLDFYLDQDSHKSYRLTLLGANGEPISNADVIISYTVIGVNEIERKQVKTNSEGEIKLGSLAIVSKISAEINNSQSNIQRAWQIDQTENNFNYNSTIYFKLGQSLTLPINQNWKSGDVLLLRTFDKFYSEDLSSKLQYEKGILRLPTINEEGYYILKLLPIDKTIEVVTLKNIPWADDTIENQKVYDEDEGTVYEISKNLYQSISINHVDFKKNQKHVDASITLNLTDIPEDRLKQVRVHVFANNYLGADVSDIFKVDKFNVQTKLQEHYLQVKKSAYYSNKTFSEEGAYVWNRQQKKEHLIGNNLEKPSIFLKRILVRETNLNEEELKEDGHYLEQCAMLDVDPNVRERFQLKNKDLSGSKLVSSGNCLNLNSHNNFLLLSGDLSSNLKANSIKLEIPLGYNSIEVYILTPKTAIKNSYVLGFNQKHQKRDLRHTGLESTEENAGWTMSREINQLLAGGKRTVNRDSQWRTVGLADIFQFASTKKVKLYDWSNHLLNWHQYDDQKKREIYDKQCCHELNTFIKFNDNAFFKEVVQNFIRNKIQKTVVDLCLLNDPSYIQYAKLNKLESLNAFQKALLVYTLVENNEIDIAKSIVDALELEQKSIKRNYEQFKTNFDTIINAKDSEQISSVMKAKRMAPQARMMNLKCSAPMSNQSMEIRSRRMQEKKAFVPVETTKQYTEKTYYNVKNYKQQAPRLIPASRFWAELARSFISKQTSLLSESFMYLRSPVEFIIAASFISKESSTNFELNNSGDKYEILAKSPMLIYVKEVKKLEYFKKFGVLINQRFFDPNNKVAYEEDGTQYEKEVEQFIVKKCYVCQTVINNTSGTPLELQVLLDIPRGTIPLRSHEYTQIVNIRIDPYSSQSYERHFYIPEEGQYEIYPSNASRGSTIIAKSDSLPPIKVKKAWTINKLQSFEDVMRSGKKNEVIAFLTNKNIFDSNVFKPQEILWMLKDKDFYHQVVQVLKKRSFFNRNIWNFAFLHADLPTIKEFINFNERDDLSPIAFEYFPYYSSRTHQFANESKSTIRNVQFKQSYIRFLVGSAIGLKQESFEVSYCYYLILQDRLREANEVIKGLSAAQLNAHQIQYDYMKCFLDLSLNAPNFTIAREITKKYAKYPLESWRKLFEEVSKTIDSQDNQFVDEQESGSAAVFQTQVIQELGLIKVIQPPGTEIIVEIFQINLELYFSEFPFIEIKTFTSIKPSRIQKFKASKDTVQNIIKRSAQSGLKDATVEITEIKNGLPRKVTSFWWTNPEVKVKVNENQGTLQVYLNKKRLAGSYVKVFSDKGMEKGFYRDGYTDMTGTFRYAMSDLDGIREFSILVMTDKGGIIQRVKPPSKLASY